MADSRLALEEYSKNVPPGWEPHLPNYPLRLYVEKFNLWRNLVKDDFQSHQMGSLMVGRLKNAANRIAMKIQIVLPDGTTVTGAVAVGTAEQPAATQQEILNAYGPDVAALFPRGYPGSKSGCDMILDWMLWQFHTELKTTMSLHRHWTDSSNLRGTIDH